MGEKNEIKCFIEALEIMDKHNMRYFLAAEHDIIYSYLETDVVPESSIDGQRLKELGWHVNGDDDSWAYFT